MIGYKAFDDRLCCRGYQFEVGKTYETGYTKNDLGLCSNTVFHFCRELQKIECVSGYRLKNSRVCEVIAEGDIVTDNSIYGTNKIRILREVPREELNRYIHNGNIGVYYTGHQNVGYCNTGDYNTGNCNTGNCNTGNCNTGSYNSGNFNSGYFNTDTPPIRIFNKETDIPLEDICFPPFLFNFEFIVWVTPNTATPEEKEKYKNELENHSGFLKTLDYKEAFRLAWDKASKEEHKKLLELPNWDNKVFKEISGIDAEKEISDEENLADEEG